MAFVQRKVKRDLEWWGGKKHINEEKMCDGRYR
jgi:hypothetical protein